VQTIGDLERLYEFRITVEAQSDELAARMHTPETLEVIEDALRELRDNHAYQQLMEIAGVDYPDRAERFEVVYMLLSVTANHRMMVKCSAAENTPVPTVTTLWPVAGCNYDSRLWYSII
jgi:NADH-quinone oxidoreductase subunit C